METMRRYSSKNFCNKLVDDQNLNISLLLGAGTGLPTNVWGGNVGAAVPHTPQSEYSSNL